MFYFMISSHKLLSYIIETGEEGPRPWNQSSGSLESIYSCAFLRHSLGL